MDESFFAAMRAPRWMKSCYNCARGCKGPGMADMIADDGQTCGFWKPSKGMFIPSAAELEGLKRQYQETSRREEKVQKGYCGRPEWADKDGCPMDNPNEEMMDCAGCVWFKETEE